MGDCYPIFCNPRGPGLPFGTWQIAIFDTARLVTILAALVVMFALGMAWGRSLPGSGQRDRYLAMALFCVVVLGTELENIGNIASYRLVLSMVGLAYISRGLWRFRNEQPAEPNSAVDENQYG